MVNNRNIDMSVCTILLNCDSMMYNDVLNYNAFIMRVDLEVL